MEHNCMKCIVDDFKTSLCEDGYCERFYGKTGNFIDLIPHWIPCSERLPEDHEPKLLTHEVHYITGKVIKDVRMAYYDDENDNWLSDEESPEILCYPLAWMPLPEPYKGGDTNE